MQNDLNDILFEGEQVLWEGKPNKFCYIWRTSGALLPFAIIWLLFDAFFIGVTVSTGATGEMFWFLLLFFGFHLMPVWICAGKFIKANAEYKNVVYAITDKRVIIRTGVIGVDFDSINYTDISKIKADVSVIESIFSVGSVFISTSSGEMACIASVKDPYKVAKMLNKVFLDVHSDIQYPNAYRPTENHGYNSQYRP